MKAVTSANGWPWMAAIRSARVAVGPKFAVIPDRNGDFHAGLSGKAEQGLGSHEA